FTEKTMDCMNDVKKLDQLVVEIRKMTDQLGRELINEHIKNLDYEIFKMPERKKSWVPVRISEKNSLMTIMGTLNYERRYYKHKITGKYTHLVDDILGLTPRQRISSELEEKLLENAADTSYERSGQESGREIVTRQTVKNIVHKYEEDEIKSEVEAINKKEIKVLYVEADEDHIALQNGSQTITKLVYVHEGKKSVGKKRKTLKNAHYFSGVKYKSQKIFEDVYNYIKKNYQEEKIERIYLMGDGASWIKRGLETLPKCKFVLDQFHIKQAMTRAMGGYDEVDKAKVLDDIREGDKEYFIKDMTEIIGKAKTEQKKKDIYKAYKYILNNWSGIEIYEQENVIGCSAEGHISHVLASRMSSRPMGWSKKGADNIARLRAFKENGGDIRDIMSYRKINVKAESKNRKELNKRLNKKIESRNNEVIDNLGAINIGHTNGLYKALKAIRNAI
ncbi:ISLre2 family transposase, partial [Vallitalea maricola]|uniref:ISLre2 family transposase n=1 Tax=Vallitalea maricola TaxID=3074433 RepID=UPI0030DD464F